MDVLKQILGRLHPLIVHLPIGFILFGLLLQWYDRKRNEFSKVLPLIYLWGGVSATLACITGYLQYLAEGYAFDTVKWHLWSGIATALFSLVMYARFKEFKAMDFLVKIPIAGLSVVFFILISFTGHQGGNITHGEDYLIEPLPNALKAALGYETFEEKKIVLTEENWEEALIYEDVIKPILNNNCVSCHNPKKTKGELLLNNAEGLLKGGENGEVIFASNSKKSELFSRMKLPLEDDAHMPPEGKKQPSQEEIQLVGAWIDAGHPFEDSITAAGFDKELFLSFFPKKHDYDFPDIQVTKASKDSISAIEKKGIHVDLISEASNFLSVSCINKPDFTDDDFKALLPIVNNIARLDLGGTKVTDGIFEKLGTLPNLTLLKLDNTSVMGEGIERLNSLLHLKSINLTSTDFKTKNLQKLTESQSLQRVYLYETEIAEKGIQTLKNEQITIEYGNYQLPLIASDTIIY